MNTRFTILHLEEMERRWAEGADAPWRELLDDRRVLCLALDDVRTLISEVRALKAILRATANESEAMKERGSMAVADRDWLARVLASDTECPGGSGCPQAVRSLPVGEKCIACWLKTAAEARARITLPEPAEGSEGGGDGT